MKPLSWPPRMLAFGAIILASSLVSVGSATAATITITGSTFLGFPGYGSGINKNNVVNFGASGITDGTKANEWKAGGSVLSEVEYYSIDWYFIGAESGDTNVFSSMGLVHTEHNENNRYQSGNDPGWQFIGTTSGSGAGPISFSVTDTNTGTGASNAANNLPQAYVGSLVFSYVEPIYKKLKKSGGLKLDGWKLTLDPTDWFVFAFDDPGSANDDHDDYIGIGHVSLAEAPAAQTPLPGTLPLMGTILGGGVLLRRLRRMWRRPEDRIAS